MSRRHRSGSGTEGGGGGFSPGGSVGAPTITITSQTQNATVYEPGTATFTVSATSLASLTYQWQKAILGAGTELTFSNISGATSSSYTTGATSAATEPYALYRCVITGGSETVTSGTASLTVVASPQITTQPLGVTVAEPATATFTVVAAGSGTLTYQWQKKEVGGSFANIGGATSASYTTGATEDTADNGDEYRCVVSNAYASATSTSAVLTVTAVVAPTVTIQPQNASVAQGDTATFTLSASGTATLTYQWYKNSVAIFGATASTYTTPVTVGATDNGATFYCIITNSAGSVQSNTVTLAVAYSTDTQAPQFSNIVATGVSSTSETITWTTDEVSTSRVEYGLTGSYGSTTIVDLTQVLSHSVTLTGLSAGQLYHYRVISIDGSGNTGTSSDQTFTTIASPDVTAPTFSSIVASSLSSTSQRITWTTNEPSSTRVEYGTTVGYGSFTTLDATLVTSHSADITGLTASTLYHYRVLSTDAATNAGTSSDGTFTTAAAADTTPPTVSGVSASQLSPTSERIQWTTDELATSRVDYGTTASYGANVTNATPKLTHSLDLTSLTPSQLYHYKITSVDASGNSTNESDRTFTTASTDVTGPTVTVTQSHASPLTSDNFYLTVTASDISGVASTSLSIDGVIAQSGTVGPFSSSPSQYTAGAHTYQVISTDSSANANVTTTNGTFTVYAVPTGGGGLVLPLTLSPQATTTLGVDGGIVFPKAALTNVADPLGYSLGVPTALRLEKDGVEVPASYRTLAVWSDGSVKSVLVSALRGNTTTNYTLFYGTGCTRSVYSTGLSVVNDSTRWTINTGVLTMTLNKTAGYLFEQLTVGGSSLLSAGADVIVRDNFDSTLYKSSNCLNPVYTIEEQTPVKVIIKHTGKLRSTASGGGGGSVTSVTKLGNQYSTLSSGWTVSGTDIYANIPSLVEYSVDCGSGGTTSVSVTAINNVNSAAPGLPGGYNFQVNVYVDSVFKTTINVPGSGSAYQTASASIAGITSGTHTFRLDWINDAWSSGVYDANIRIASSSYVTNSAGGSVAGDSVDYILRYTLYGGSDLVELDGTIVDTQEETNKAIDPTYLASGADTGMARSLSAWYYQIPYSLTGTQTYTFGTTGTNTASGTVTSEHYILQTGNDNVLGGNSYANNLLLERETGTLGTDLNGKWSGWGDVSNSSRGITTLINDPWQKYPHGMRVQSNTLYVDLQPQRASDKPVLSDPQSNRFQRPRTLYFPRHGDAYTERTLFSFHSGAHRGAVLNASWQDKPRFTASSQWMCDSKAFGNLIPTGADSVGHDAWVNDLMNRYITSREPLGGAYIRSDGVTMDGDEEIMYGKRDHGCSTYFGSNGGKTETYSRRWRVNLNDTHIGIGRFYHVQWARTKNDIFNKTGRQRSRHWMDHDVSHCNRRGQVNYPGNLGPGEPHNRHHNDSQTDHVAAEMNDNHCSNGGLPQYYLLYGDLRALDVLKEVGNFITATINTDFRFQLPFSTKFPSYPAAGSFEHRDWAWSPWTLLEISRVVNDSAYRTALGRVGTFLQQWFRQTVYGHVQAGATVHANNPAIGRGAWYLPANSANNTNATTWNGGSCWFHLALVTVAIQMFEEGKDYSTIWGGYTAAQWLDMILQNVESCVRHSYQVTIGHGNYWLYDESRNTWANEYGKTGNDGGGAPHTFEAGKVLSGGGSYALAWAYDKLTNGDSVAGSHANPSWFTTQNSTVKLWQELSYNALADLKTVRTFGYLDNVRVFSNGWYYEPLFLQDFFTIARNIPSLSGGGGSGVQIDPVLILGASHTVGINGGGGPGVGGYLTGRIPSGSIVYAVSGYGHEQVNDNYVQTVSSVPDTVVILTGHNNDSGTSCASTVSPCAYNELGSLVDALKSKGAIRILIVTCSGRSATDALPYDIYNDFFVTYNAQVRAYALANDCEIFDYEALSKGVWPSGHWDSDGIHHTADGKQAYTDGLIAAINANPLPGQGGGGGSGTSAPNINFSSSVGTTPVAPGTSVTLSWTVTDATSLTATGGSGGGTPTGNPVMVLGDTLISQPNTAGLFSGRLPTGSSVVATALINVRDTIDDVVTPLTSVPATVYVCLGLYNNNNNSQIAYVTELVALLKSKGATRVIWQNCTASSGNAASTDFYDNNYVTWNGQLTTRSTIDGFEISDYKTAFLGQTARFNGDLITHTTTGQQALVDFIVSKMGIQTVSAWAGAKSLPTGSEAVTPTATTTYSLTATGAGGTTGPISVTVNVSPPGGGWVEVWRQDFNGGPGLAENILPSTEWGYRGVPGGSQDVDVTGNLAGGSTAWRSQNCTLDGNSNLVIEMRQESYLGMSYTSGEMWTRHRFFRKYGRITFRAKWTAQNGMFPAGWMQGEAWTNTGGQTQNWTGTGEIDVFEWKGGAIDVFHVLQNFINPNGGASYSDAGWASNTIPGGGQVDEFHEYFLEWTYNGVKLGIDGTVIRESARDQHFDWDHAVDSVSDGVHYVGTTYDLPFFLMLSLQGRSGQAGGTYPAKLTVDWIKWEDPV